MFYFKRIIYYNAFQISTPTFVISEIIKLLQYHAILMQHDQWQMGWESAGYRGIVNYFILDIPELELPLMLVQTLFHIVFVLCVIKSYYDITKRISYLYLLGLQLGLYNMFVINAIRVLGQNSEINFQFMMSLFNLLFTNLSQYLSCYILRKIRLVSYCDTLFISQLTTIINSYLYFQPFSNQMAYLKILALALDRFRQIFESIFYIQYKYEWQGIYFAFEQCKNISFLIVFLQVISSFQLFNNQYVVLYIILCSILAFEISIQFSHLIYDTGTIISNQNHFAYMISMIDYYENKKSSFQYFFVKSLHFDVCKKCKNKYKRMGIKRIKKCLFEQLLLFKPNETNFMLYMEYVNQGQKQQMLAYIWLRQYYCNNQNLSYYFRVKQQVMSKNLQMQINQTKVDLRHIDEIQSNRNTFEESLKFNEIQLKVLPQILKIVSCKIDLWQQQIKGFQDIYEFQQESISICSLIVKLKKDLEQLLNIDLAHNKVFTNMRNLFTLKYLSLYYIVIMNDLNRGIQIELQYWDVFQAEIGYPNLEINPLYVLQDQICIIDISMIKNLGEIVNDKKYILNFFNYSINDSILIKNVNDLLPQFLAQRHHDQLQKFIQVGQSQMLKKFKLLFGQSKKGFIIPFEIKLVNNFEFTEDFILKGVLAKNNENEFIIFNNQGRILGITQKLFQLLCKYDSQYFQFIKNIGIEQIFPNISDFICKLEYDTKEAPIAYLEDESLLTLKSNFFQYSIVKLDNYVFGNMSQLYDTFIYIEQAGYISSVIIDLGFIPSENATYTKFVSILLSKSKIVFKAGLLKPEQISQILNASFLNTLLSIRYNVRNLYLMNQEIINTIVMLFQRDFNDTEQQNLNIFIVQMILVYILITLQFFILKNLEIHNQNIIKLIGRSTEDHIIEQIIIYQDILAKISEQDGKGWKLIQFSQLCYQESTNEQKEYSIKNQKNKQSQLHSRIKSDKINFNVQTMGLTSYLLVIFLFSLGGYIQFKVQYDNLQPIQNLNLNYAKFTTQLDSLISASIIEKLQPLIFNEFVKRNIYTRAQLNTLNNARIFTVWNAVNKKYYDYFSQLYEGMIKLKTSSSSKYESLNEIFTGDLCKKTKIRFCYLNNMSQSNFISKYGQYDQSDDIRQYVSSGIQGIIDQVQQSIAQDFTYEKKNNLYSSNLDELSQLVNTKEFNHVYINHFTDSYSLIQQFLTILEQTTKDFITEHFQSFTLYMILVGTMLILSIVTALVYLVRRTQLRIKYLKMSILLMPYEQQVTPQAMSIIKRIK